jgi:tetratricopeptide (TPR) repeat protein
MLFDARHYSTASRYFRQGIDLASTIDDQPYIANVLACMSLQATYTDEAPQAAELAQAAQDCARGRATPRVMSMLAMREAFAHAAIGDASGCHVVLATAHRMFEKIQPGDEDPAWIAYFDEVKLLADTGIARGRLGEHATAERLIGEALSQEAPTHRRTRAFHAFWLATAQLQQGDLDEACHHASEALSLAVQVDSPRIAEHVREFRTMLAPYDREKPAKEFRARLTELNR